MVTYPFERTVQIDPRTSEDRPPDAPFLLDAIRMMRSDARRLGLVLSPPKIERVPTSGPYVKYRVTATGARKEP